MSNALKRSFDKLTSAVGIQNSKETGNEKYDQFLPTAVTDTLENFPDNVSLHEQNGDAVWVSSKSITELKRPIINLLGKGFFENANPQDKLKILKAFSDCSVTGSDQCIDFRCQRPSINGEVVVVSYELRISAFKHQDNKLYLALVRDNTEQQDQLKKARKEIEKAKSSNTTKSLFLSNMSHELRTPLNAIIGFSQMLMGEAAVEISEEKKLEYAGLVNQSASHLLNIINDVLDLSKIEAGKFQIIPEVIDASQALRSTLKLMKPIADKANIDIKSNIADELPHIVADPRALRQIIINLVANAIKFSSENDEVVLSLKRDRRKICLKVSDNGLGMTQDAVNRLGDTFFQAEQTSTKRFEGTGLGLSIVFGLIKLHDGSITFHSELNKGTTVVVELPISNQHSIPIPSDPDDAIVFLNEKREPNLLRKLDTYKIDRKVG